MVVRPIPKPKPPPAADPAAPAAAPRSWPAYALVLALVPLGVMVAVPPEDLGARIDRMLEANPQLASQVYDREQGLGGGLGIEDFLDLAPGARVDGALHGRTTVMHWLYALAAAVCFWGFVRFAFPLGRTTSAQFWKVGFLVGTAGILLLLGVQAIAGFTQGWIVTGANPLVLIFWIVKFIGYSYGAAMEPGNGFAMSLLGFTFGVGLCEELVKALPILWHMKQKATLDAAGASLWGLAAGVGFGVGEGVIYCGDFYNGISTWPVYLVRFTSCVALHAVWSGAAGILIWRFQREVQGLGKWYEWFKPAAMTLGGAIVLHGLYDTFLKRDLEIAALVTAVVSVAGFFALTAWARRPEVVAAVPAPQEPPEE